MHSQNVAGIILAAGKGTRMKSDLPKGLHKVGGLPMVELVARSMQKAGVERIVIVIGHGGELIQQALGDKYEYVWQREQLGTGHAALMAKDLLGNHPGPVVIAPGDAPLLNETIFRELIQAHADADFTVATAVIDNPHGYGRIVRIDNKPVKIVEQKDATEEQKKINEINAAIYCVDAQKLYETLPNLKNDNAQGEYYLTDVLDNFASRGLKVGAYVSTNPDLLVGVNDRWQLAQAEKALRFSILKDLALSGVTIMDPDTTYVGVDVTVGPDTVLEPSTYLQGNTSVGAGCRIGPNTQISNSQIGDNCTILMSNIADATLGDEVWCGPFANLRPKTKLDNGVKIGNFVEVKNSHLEEESKVSHLSYIGDASVGARTNIGAGTITCNYDGFVKSRTQIGSDAFVGSNSTLVAPLTIGNGAMVAAGSVITRPIPDDSAGFGRARQETKEGWAANWRKLK